MMKGPVMVATCRCGGWVMVATEESLHIKDSLKEAAKLVREGFDFRRFVPWDEYMAIPACEHSGDCTTDPDSFHVHDPAQIEMEVSP